MYTYIYIYIHTDYISLYISIYLSLSIYLSISLSLYIYIYIGLHIHIQYTTCTHTETAPRGSRQADPHRLPEGQDRAVPGCDRLAEDEGRELSNRHRLNGYLAHGVPSVCLLAGSFGMCSICAVLEGMFPWSFRYCTH